MSGSIEAFLDDYRKIVVQVSEYYYGGHCDQFYLLNEKDEIIETRIVHKYQDAGYWKYELSVIEDVVMGHDYDVLCNYGYRTHLQFRGVVFTSRFEDEYFYEGNDLGANIYDKSTTFKCWAPTATQVRLAFYLDDKEMVINMRREQKGVYYTKVPFDLHGARYNYIVHVNGKINKTIDPYGRSTDCNAKSSVVVNVLKLKQQRTPHVKCVNSTDAIIYEASIRDMTSSPSANTKSKSTFEALCELNTSYQGVSTGFSHIQELGATHVQLLPVCDFVTVEEAHPHLLYNWGYDPNHYFSLEGGYSENPHQGEKKCEEFMRLVNLFHENGMGVVMDMVFNHQYDHRLSCLELTVPFYYFRFHDNLVMSNGSYCGNDLETRRRMVRKLVISSCEFFSDVYGIDGFRFDLMGIIDVTTMNHLRDELQRNNPYVLLYGEGWNMPTALAEDEKANINNYQYMKEIGLFSDMFRDVMKGKTHESEREQQGYLTGNFWLQEAAQSCIGARRYPFAKRAFDDPSVTVNYMECHDNMTLWDKIEYCCKHEDFEKHKQRQKLCIGVMLLSQGIPFIHAGQEFCRTKNGIDNTYNMSDEINKMDYQRKLEFIDVVNYTKDCIALRKEYAAFRLNTPSLCSHHITMRVDGEVLIYHIKQLEKMCNVKSIQVIINPSNSDYFRDTKGFLCVLDQRGKCERYVDQIEIEACSMVVLVEK